MPAPSDYDHDHERDGGASASPTVPVVLVSAVDATILGEGLPVVCRTTTGRMVVVRPQEETRARIARITTYGPAVVEIHCDHLFRDGTADLAEPTARQARDVLAGQVVHTHFRRLGDTTCSTAALRLPIPSEFRDFYPADPHSTRTAVEADEHLTATATTPVPHGIEPGEDLRTACRRILDEEAALSRRLLEATLRDEVAPRLLRAAQIARRLDRRSDLRPEVADGAGGALPVDLDDLWTRTIAVLGGVEPAGVSR